jgi:hypothetical protein
MLFFDPEYARTFSKNSLVKNLGSAYGSANIRGAAFLAIFVATSLLPDPDCRL